VESNRDGMVSVLLTKTKIKKMKKLLNLLLLFVLISCTAEAQEVHGIPDNLREEIIIEGDIFKIWYSEVKEQPTKVTYTVLCPLPGVSRDGLDFYEESEYHTSDDDDYYRNEWDKGHMAPAAAFNCTREMLKKTFTYLNSALQHESLNRGVWNKLEEFERNLANFYEVKVEIQVNFIENPPKVPGGASIPESFLKIIRWEGKEVRFLFPNQNTSGTDWTDYIQAQ